MNTSPRMATQAEACMPSYEDWSRMMDGRRCADTGRHHSDDLVTVYMGREDGPRVLCGYHAFANTNYVNVP